MGLTPTTLRNLIELRRRGDLRDQMRVAEIGAQQLSDPFLHAKEEISELYRLFNRPIPSLGDPAEISYVDGVPALRADAPSSINFWRSLGFSYEAIEYGGYRNSVSVDLNTDVLPERLRCSFDLVVNAGTTEHVANQNNAFKIIHDLTKPNGLMMHDLPAGGMITHGLVGYNIYFFWVLARDNDYEVIDLGLHHHGEETVPASVVESNKQYCSLEHNKHTLIHQDTSLPILSIRAIFRKRNSNDYRTPLDVPPDAKKSFMSRLFNIRR